MKAKFTSEQVQSVHVPCTKIINGEKVKYPLKFDGKEHEISAEDLHKICINLTNRAFPDSGITFAKPGQNLGTTCKIEVESVIEYKVEKDDKGKEISREAVYGFAPIDIEAMAANGYKEVEPKETVKIVKTKKVSAKAAKAKKTPAVNTETTDDDNADSD